MAPSIDSWIAPLIEDCLSVRWNASQVEDDGSNIRFSNTLQKLVLVNSVSCLRFIPSNGLRIADVPVRLFSGLNPMRHPQSV